MRPKETVPITGGDSGLGREMALGFMVGQVSSPNGGCVI